MRFLRRWTSFNLFLPDVDASVSQLSLNGVRFPESAFSDRYDKRSFAKKKRNLFLNLEWCKSSQILQNGATSHPKIDLATTDDLSC